VAGNKTLPTDADVDDFLAAIENDQRRHDCMTLRGLMEEASGHPPVMWGPSIVGFGSQHYRYETGREGDWPVLAFSPRKAAISLYGLHSAYDGPNPLLDKLGIHRAGVGCLYVKRLSDVDLSVLVQLMKKAVAFHSPD
jgi:hypothetical protein